MRPALAALVLLALSLAAAGCNSMPGQPPPGPEVPRPDQVLDAGVLYRQNCSGCHGDQGAYGPATPLANPEYQALVSDDILRGTIAHGQTGSLMPGFSQAEGGTLTAEQIESIIKGMRQHWYKGPVLGDHAPPYAAKAPGDAAAGEAVYSGHCAMCHGEVSKDGKGQLTVDPGSAGPLINSSLLALITPQAIRTTVIVGRPDLGMPDWRDEPGSTLSDADITNVVAFLEAQRPARPGEVFGQPQQLAPVPKRPDVAPHRPAFTNRTKAVKENQ